MEKVYNAMIMVLIYLICVVIIYIFVALNKLNIIRTDILFLEMTHVNSKMIMEEVTHLPPTVL